jgi:hypothetical protein
MHTKQQQDENDAAYAEQFNEADQPKMAKTEDEEFGLGPETAAAETPASEAAEPAAEEAAESPAAEAAEPAAEQAAEAAAPAGEPAAEAAPVDQEQRLKSWEGRLKARQAELDAREAAMGNSSVNDEQASLPLDEGGEGGEGEGGEGEGGAASDDPAAVLAEDFGADFVHQLTSLIKHVAGEAVGGVCAQVDGVIADLKNERLQNHFNAIADTHADFMDVVESPEFAAWKAAQPDQAGLQQVIDGGSARQIIAMLSAFKGAYKKDDAGNEGNEGNEGDEYDAAEGVRSSGVHLPQEPAASDDFAKAWNEA